MRGAMRGCAVSCGVPTRGDRDGRFPTSCVPMSHSSTGRVPVVSPRATCVPTGHVLMSGDPAMSL